MPYKTPNSPESVEAARKARRKHYRENREQYYANNRKKKAAMRAWLNEIKSVPCLDCGERYPPYVMDLDHRNPTDKSGSMARFVNGGSWRKLRAEVEKCDVVCANCHRERTAKQLGHI